MTDNHEFLILQVTMFTLFLTGMGIFITQIRDLKTDLNRRFDGLRNELNRRVDAPKINPNSLSARLETLNTKVENLNSTVNAIREYA